MGRHWSTVGLQPGILSLSHISAGKHRPCATSSQGPGPCQQPPAHCSGATTLLPPGTPCFYTCRSQEGLGQELMGGVGPGSECCCHGRGRGICCGCLSAPWEYQGPLDMPSATVPGQLGCCRGALGGGEPPHIPARSWSGLPFRAPSTTFSLCRADHGLGHQ